MADEDNQQSPAPLPSRVGNDSVVYGIVQHRNVGDRSVVIGPTDDKGNIILRPAPGGTAIGAGAKAGPNSLSVGARAGSGVARPNVNYSISIGTMTGSAIQQGSPGATQSVRFELKIDEAKSALAAFEAAIKAAQLPKARHDEVAAGLQTISAQLSKVSPSLPILQEAGRSLRNILEGVAAGLMTPSVVAMRLDRLRSDDPR